MTAGRRIHPVILSGGTGTRLWPLSRALAPKQLLPLVSKRSLLQDTVLRAAELTPEVPTIICNEEHRFMIAQQMQDIGIPVRIVLEPEGRNTAVASAVGAVMVSSEDADGLVLLLPADHAIAGTENFARAVSCAAAAAEDYLVTFGIVPAEANPGYGYIRPDNRKPLMEGVLAVERFVEKPSLEEAKKYVREGYLWNSGMFMFAAKVFLGELTVLAPDILTAAENSVRKAKRDHDFIRLDPEAFRGAREISVDHAVMEHTKRAAVVPADIGWSDVGSWTALWQSGPQDASSNVAVGDVVLYESTNCYARSEKGIVALLGVEELIVVATDDAVLVVAKDRAQDVRKIVSDLKERDRTEYAMHSRVFRPWGDYRTVDSGKGFQVKQITVKPGASLSLQYHRHRAEHWVVVQGIARVTRGEETITLNENESTFIPVGTKHRLENPGETPLRIIEVQSGSYLGEDDIVRLDDVYGRK